MTWWSYAFLKHYDQSVLEDEMVFRVGGDELLQQHNWDMLVGYTRSQVSNLLHSENISFSYGIEVTNQDNFQQALEESDKAM